MQYQRFISYLYQYKDGEKVQNTGYVKVEQKGSMIRISLKSKVMEYNQPVYYAYLISKQTENVSYGFLLDRLTSSQGILTYQHITEFLTIDDYIGVLIKGERTMYMTLWQDVELLPEHVICTENSSSEQFDTDYAASEMPLQSNAQALGIDASNEDVQSLKWEGGQGQKDFDETRDAAIDEGQVMAEGAVAEDGRVMAASVAPEEAQMMEESAAAEERQIMAASVAPEEEQIMADSATVHGRQMMADSAAVDGRQIMADSAAVDGRQMVAESAAADGRQMVAEDTVADENRMVTEDSIAENTAAGNRSEQSAPRGGEQYRSGADYLFKNRASLPAVEGSQLLDCIRIVPQDLGLLHMQNWRYGNNSFLSHGYYRYRYLLLGKLKFQDNSVKIILGVPSIYTNKERYLANMFGFDQFVTARRTDRKLGQFGYWIVELTS